MKYLVIAFLIVAVIPAFAVEIDPCLKVQAEVNVEIVGDSSYSVICGSELRDTVALIATWIKYGYYCDSDKTLKLIGQLSSGDSKCQAFQVCEITGYTIWEGGGETHYDCPREVLQ